MGVLLNPGAAASSRFLFFGRLKCHILGRMKRTRRRRRVGRPRRTDDPTRMNLRLPGALRTWLRARARAENRDQSQVVVDALALYRKHRPDVDLELESLLQRDLAQAKGLAEGTIVPMRKTQRRDPRP